MSHFFYSKFTYYFSSFKNLLQDDECHWNMETLNIIQEEGITAAYGNFKALNIEIHML